MGLNAVFPSQEKIPTTTRSLIPGFAPTRGERNPAASPSFTGSRPCRRASATAGPAALVTAHCGDLSCPVHGWICPAGKSDHPQARPGPARPPSLRGDGPPGPDHKDPAPPGPGLEHVLGSLFHFSDLETKRFIGPSFFQGSCLLNYRVIKMLMAVYRTFSSQPNCFVNNTERPLCCGGE